MRILNILCDFPFSQNNSLKSAYDYYIYFFGGGEEGGTVLDEIGKPKETTHCVLNHVSHGACSHISACTNAVANRVTLQLHLRHDFHNSF
jgi:hypothetical protein